MSYTWWHERKEDLPEDGDVCVFHIKGRKPVSSRGMSIMFGSYTEVYGFYAQGKHEFYPPEKIDYWMPVPLLPEKVRK